MYPFYLDINIVIETPKLKVNFVFHAFSLNFLCGLLKLSHRFYIPAKTFVFKNMSISDKYSTKLHRYRDFKPYVYF